MADSIDKLPLGIYKSMFNKIYNRLNQPLIYEERLRLPPKAFTSTDKYSPCRNTDSDYELVKRMLESRKINKELNKKSRETFLEDYIKSLE